MQPNRYNLVGKKVWIIAGEESGDLYGAELTRMLHAAAPDLIVQGMGGNHMRGAGVEILIDSTELGVVGIVEVLKNISLFYKLLNDLTAMALVQKPNVVVLIDYPGFNLRLASKLRPFGIRIVYYISPQVWAWNARRIPRIARLIDKMLVIFPFEKELYAQTSLNTVFVGHPLVSLMRKKIAASLNHDPYLILLLPGSRFSEIDRLLEPMYEAACQLFQRDKNFRFVVATPREAIRERVQQVLAHLRIKSNRLAPPISIACGDMEVWMQKAIAGIAASGTVTVQCACFNLPLVVIYKVNPMTYWLGKILIKVRYITMVNIIARKIVFEEYIQEDIIPSHLVAALERILIHGSRREHTLKDMATVIDELTGPADPSQLAAEEILKEL